jgi:hypothetical protein
MRVTCWWYNEKIEGKDIQCKVDEKIILEVFPVIAGPASVVEFFSEAVL